MNPTHHAAWLLVAATAIGLLVQLVKSGDAQRVFEKTFGRPLPKQYLPLLSLVLGIAYAVIDAVVQGLPMAEAAPHALQDALTAGGLPVVVHEILTPRNRVPTEAPSSKPPSKPPPGPPPSPPAFTGAALLMLVLALSACSAEGRRNARTALDAFQIACVLATELTEEASVAAVCGISQDLIPHLREALRGKHTGRSAGKPGKAATDACDGGSGVPSGSAPLLQREFLPRDLLPYPAARPDAAVDGGR